MLIIAILALLLAATSSYDRSYKTLAEYVKFNRIVFIVFILASYLTFNTIELNVLNNGTLIWGGVFKINMLSQVFDCILLITGAFVSLLTSFIPYNYRKYYDEESMNFIINSKYHTNISNKLESNYNKVSFYNYYINKLLSYYDHNNFQNKPKLLIFITKIMNKFINSLPEFKINTPFFVNKDLEDSKIEAKEFNLLLIFTVIGGSLLISSNNLISLYLSLELQSFSLYILSSSQIKSFFGTSGGLKYFLLGGLSSGFILLGASLLYGYTGALNFDDIFKIYSDTSTNYFIDPCLLILFAGLLFKVSAAPFHNWAPDVYNQVPTISTTWLIVIAKISIFILMLILVHQIRIALDLNNLSNIQQLYSVDNHKLFDFYAITTIFDDININFKSLFNFSDSFISGQVQLHKNYEFTEAKVSPFLLPNYSSIGIWTNILTFSAILSLLIGTFVGVTQNSVKRLYSYSTISHVGFLLLALSVNSLSSIDAFLFYLIQYTITNLNLFFILIAWGYIYVRYFRESTREFKAIRLIKVNPISLKDVYFDPTIYDLIESINQELSEFNKENKLYLKNELFKISTINDYSFTHELERHSNIYNNYKEWIYTPVPYIVNFKGMFKSDPMLAFCFAITLFSLAGIFLECQSIYLLYIYLLIILYAKIIIHLFSFFWWFKRSKSHILTLYMGKFASYLSSFKEVNIFRDLKYYIFLWSKSPVYKYIFNYFNSVVYYNYILIIRNFLPLTVFYSYLNLSIIKMSYFVLVKEKTYMSNSVSGYYSPKSEDFNIASSYQDNLGSYLAGLIEGDGHIYVPSGAGAQITKNVPHIEIAFDIKDKPLFEKIQERLKGGYIVIRKNKRSGRLTIKKKLVLLKLITLINSHMRTPKIEALHRLIDWFNLSKGTKLVKCDIDKSDILNNSWLSGFLEADGNFYLNFKINQDLSHNDFKIKDIVYYMRLSQRQNYTRKVNSIVHLSYLEIMDNIAKALNTTVINIYRDRIKYEEHSYLIRTDKIISKNKIFSYLNKFPLFGYKYFAHKNLESIHILVRNKEYKLKDGKLKFIKLYERIKYDPNKDDWNHLDKFYNI